MKRQTEESYYGKRGKGGNSHKGKGETKKGGGKFPYGKGYEIQHHQNYQNFQKYLQYSKFLHQELQQN